MPLFWMLKIFQKNMKKIILLAFLCCFFAAFGQIPTDYYNAAIGKSGYELKSTLSQIIGNHTILTYGSDNPGGLWNAFRTTDVRPDSTVWDIYSNCTFYPWVDGHITGQGECAGGTQQEHTFCQSWMNYCSTPLYSDLFHIYPVDAWVNGRRSNYPYGEVPNQEGWVQRTFQNGARLGYNAFVASDLSSYCDKAYEPIDEYKGDIARGFFYIATRYMFEDSEFSTTHAMTYRSQLRPWALDLMKKWNKQDPVSTKETNRNNAIYTQFQHNRNPYIDFPYLVDLVFGPDSADVKFHPYLCEPPVNLIVSPNPQQNLSAHLSWTNPSKRIDGTDCENMHSLIIMRNGIIVHTVLNPIAGQTMSWLDMSIPQSGYYEYKVFVINEVGRGLAATERVFVGQDCPVKVELFDAAYEEWKGCSLEFRDDDNHLLASVRRHCGEDTSNIHIVSLPPQSIHCVWVPGESDAQASFKISSLAGDSILTTHFSLVYDDSLAQNVYHSDLENMSGEMTVFANNHCGHAAPPCRVVDTISLSVNSLDLPYYYAPGDITIVEGLPNVMYGFLRPGNGECDTLVILNCEITSGINEFTQGSCLVQPNPTTGVVFIEAPQEILSISIYQSNGVLLKNRTTKKEKTSIVNLSSYPSGLYILHVQMADGTQLVRKVIKTN